MRIIRHCTAGTDGQLTTRGREDRLGFRHKREGEEFKGTFLSELTAPCLFPFDFTTDLSHYFGMSTAVSKSGSSLVTEESMNEGRVKYKL